MMYFMVFFVLLELSGVLILRCGIKCPPRRHFLSYWLSIICLQYLFFLFLFLALYTIKCRPDRYVSLCALEDLYFLNFHVIYNWFFLYFQVIHCRLFGLVTNVFIIYIEFVVSKGLRAIVVGLWLKASSNIDFILREADFDYQKCKSLNYCVEESPDSYNWAPSYRSFQTGHHIWWRQLHYMIVDSFSALCDLSPTVNACNFAIKCFTRILIDVQNSFSQLAQHRFFIRFSKICHMWRQNFWHSANISWNNKKTAASCFKDCNTERLRQTCVQKDMSSA